jgi:putative hemolysin
VQNFFTHNRSVKTADNVAVMPARKNLGIKPVKRQSVFGQRRHIVHELLEERTETLRKVPFLWWAITRWCLPFCKYQEAIDWVDRLALCDGREAMQIFADFLDLDVRVQGFEHVPKTGRVLIAVNHPTGFVDAWAIHAAIGAIRPDLRYFSNRDVVRLVPRTRELIIPLEWLRPRRTPAAMRETLEASRAAFEKECAVVIFPGGGIARGSLLGLSELDWLTATVKLMRRYDCTVLPVHIRARNSWFYYLLEVIHHELRDLLRFREVLAKRRQRFDVTIGRPISPHAITGTPNEAIASLQAYVERELRRGKSWPVPSNCDFVMVK